MFATRRRAVAIDAIESFSRRPGHLRFLLAITSAVSFFMTAVKDMMLGIKYMTAGDRERRPYV
jgi:multidrug transporter EmrE-like cation transporter